MQAFPMITPALSAIRVNALGIIKKRRVVTNLLALILFVLLFPCPQAKAQGVSWGLSIGTPLNDLATADSTRGANTTRFTLGPSLRIALPFSFGLDLDVLYKQFEFGLASNPSRFTAHRFELVPMLRYDFTHLPIHPYVHAGLSFNRVLALGGSNICADASAGSKRYYCVEGITVAELRHSHTYGLVLGGGLDFNLIALHLTPELRITRWVDRSFGTQDSSLQSNLTQAEFLLAILF